jgi:trk system potassium uptake protein TrkA
LEKKSLCRYIPIHKKISDIENEFKNFKVVSYKTEGNWSLNIDSNHKIKKDDLLVFLGESKNIKEFYKQIDL